MVRGHKVDLARRPKDLSKLGREVLMELNTFAVKVPTIKVYQYQVLIGSGAEKRGLIKKAWLSEAVQSQLPKARSWIFDGNTLAWSTDDMAEKRVQVDLDAEQGRKPRKDGKTNSHRVIVKKTGHVDFASLMAYINGHADFNNKCLEAITFADHLMREHPSQQYSQIKRSFFSRGQRRHPLGGGVEAFKGVYQSIRIAYPASLTVNVDVSNGTFWTAGPLSTTVIAAARLRGEADIPNLLTDRGRNQFVELKRLRKLHVFCKHRKNTDGTPGKDEYVIDRFLNKDATTHMLDMKDKPKVSVAQYFQQTHNLKLRNPKWPVIQMTKKAVIPLELLFLDENQRYVYKLDDRQTSSMIKVAVTPPKERWADIEHGLNMLSWANDPYLKHYDMKISPTPTRVKARLLPNPKLEFGNKPDTDPRTSGRWDLKGKKFASPNPAPLTSWGVCCVPGFRGPGCDVTTARRFITEFVKIYTGHGGKVANAQPHVEIGPSSDPGKCVEDLWNHTGAKFNLRPQILMFILPDRDSNVYGRIKRTAECRYGVMSQCMQSLHVQKCQPQYISNVCMKFNAKLGGFTNRAVGAKTAGKTGIFKVPTVVIGADVSHAAPGSQTPSMAAMTVSTDICATRYAAACETNGYRLEMITPKNINTHLKALLHRWVTTVGGGRFPQQIIYFRDGVSEGQFSHVIEQEVGEIKKMLKVIDPNTERLCKFVVIVASKRHHVRFFPKDNAGADRNGNPLPGTLVETGVTHPFENDFYMCSHAALKGTARPVHYNVLLNESGISQDDIHMLIYEHCYQYIRATTPVSLFPAVYYAHLASKRAAHHDKFFGGQNSNERATQGGKTASSDTPEEYLPLLAMIEHPSQTEDMKIKNGMWYI